MPIYIAIIIGSCFADVNVYCKHTRFLPEPVVLLLRSKAGSASLKALDDVCEHPELIWTAEMQGELREALTKLLKSGTGGAAIKASDFSEPPSILLEYVVPYRQLDQELYVGGVYIRLFLKQPTFRLSNPLLFTEKLIEFWEGSFNVQVPPKSAGGSYRGEEFLGDSRAVVLGKEDFLTLITSCIVCVVKGEPVVLDQLLSWGFMHLLCDLMRRALDADRRGTPVTCIVRLLHQFVGRVDTIDNLAGSPIDVVLQLTRALDLNSNRKDSAPELAKEAAFTVEVLKKIYQCIASRNLGHFVLMGMQADLPNFLLDHIVGAPKSKLENVRNSSALRIHAVDVLKAMVSADEANAAVLQALLDLHPAWGEFKEQSHDLFITVRKRQLD